MNRVLRRVGRWAALGVLGIVALLGIASIASFVNNLRLPSEPPSAHRLDAREAARLAEAHRLRTTLGDAVWPGWGEASIPLIVYNESHAFLVGHEDPPPGWVTVPGGESVGGPWEWVVEDTLPSGGYHRSELPAGVTPQAFTVRIGGSWAASLGTKSWMEFELVRTLRSELPPVVRHVFPYRLFGKQLLKGTDGHVAALLHESFHAYQGMAASARLIGGELAIGAGERAYPWDDQAHQAAWQTELDILARALRAGTEVEAAELAAAFLAQRVRRRQALSASHAAHERQREWTEGLAKYVELTIWRAADRDAGYRPVAALEADRDFLEYRAAVRKWNEEIEQMTRMAGDHGDGRFYYTGMALAVLLDRLAPGWKARVLVDGGFQEDLLREAVGGATDSVSADAPEGTS